MIAISVNNTLQLPQVMGIAKDMCSGIAEVDLVVIMNQYPGESQQNAH